MIIPGKYTGSLRTYLKKRRLKYYPYILFWLLGIVWGTSFIFMKMASEYISPAQIVLLRLVFGFIPIAIYAWHKRVLKISHARHIGHFLLMSVIGTIAYYYGFAKSASMLNSAVVGALSGLTPIFSYLLALLLLSDEKTSGQKIIGIGIGFFGVVMIAQPFNSGDSITSFEGVAYALMGSFGIGASFVYVKKYMLPLGIPASALITYQLGLGIIILLIAIDTSHIGRIGENTNAALGLVVGLGIIGTGLAYIMYYTIIDKLGAVTASSVAYLPPIVALAIGILLVGEHILLVEFIGAASILAGLALINRAKSAVN